MRYVTLYLTIFFLLLIVAALVIRGNFLEKHQAKLDIEPSKAITSPIKNALVRGQMFKCTPTRLWDGDGPIWCAEGPKVRLAGIAAREMDESCKANHPCPEADGEEARNVLAGMLGRTIGRSSEGHLVIDGPTLTCVSAGSAGRGRTAAWCISPSEGDLSCSMILAGMALRWDRYWDGHKCSH